MKYSIRKVIRLLKEIESQIESDTFYNLEWEEYDDEQLEIEGIASQEELLTALDEAMTHLNDIAPYEKETLLYKISLSDKESTQGFQLYDVSYKEKVIGTCSAKELRQYIDISEVEKNGFGVISSQEIKKAETLFKGGK